MLIYELNGQLKANWLVMCIQMFTTILRSMTVYVCIETSASNGSKPASFACTCTVTDSRTWGKRSKCPSPPVVAKPRYDIEKLCNSSWLHERQRKSKDQQQGGCCCYGGRIPSCCAMSLCEAMAAVNPPVRLAILNYPSASHGRQKKNLQIAVETRDACREPLSQAR